MYKDIHVHLCINIYLEHHYCIMKEHSFSLLRVTNTL